jgi:hypothetical protein
MRRYTAVALLLGTLSGCVALDTGPDSGGLRPLHAQGAGPPTVPGLQGPHGEPVPMAKPYAFNPPGNDWMAREMMQHNIPLNQVQMNGPMGLPGGMMPGMLSPPGMPAMPGGPAGGMANPTARITPPGPGGPGSDAASDIQLAQFALNPAAAGVPRPGLRTQVRFTRPVGMQVAWFGMGPDGRPMYSPTPIDTPGKYNFLQGARYRLKLTSIPGRPGLELYPTLEVVPANHKAEAFLAHSSVPLEFTEEDLKQVAEGNYVVKVVYLPDPQFQDVAGTGTDEILSTRLEPGQDPIQEALRRGSILLIVRMGNIDQEAPNTPPLASPAPPGPPAMGGHGPNGPTFGPTMPGVLPSPIQVPYWFNPPNTPPAPGAVPPGAMPPGALPPGGIPPGAIPPGAIPPGAIPPGAIPPGAIPGGIPPGAIPGGIPPGAIPQGAFPQGAFPQGAFPPGVIPPGATPQGAFPQGAIPPGVIPNQGPGVLQGLPFPGATPSATPPNLLPQGAVPQGAVPQNAVPFNPVPSTPAPVAPKALPTGPATPANKAPTSTTSDSTKTTAPVAPASVSPASNSSAVPGLPPLPSSSTPASATSSTPTNTPTLPPSIVPGLPK